MVATKVEDRGETLGCGPWIETATTYDIFGNRLSESREIDAETSATTRFYYDRDGRTVLTVHLEGNADYTDYDSVGRQVRTYTGLTTLDSLPTAMRAKIVNAPTLSCSLTGSPSISITNYDIRNRVEYIEQVINGTTTTMKTFAYDAYNRKIRETDPLGNYTTWVYDSNNRLTDLKQYGYIDKAAQDAGTTALLAQTNYVYDNAGRQIQVNRKADLATGVSGRLARSVSITADNSLDQKPGSGVWVATRTLYDAAGRAWRTINDDGSSTTLSFDGMGRTIRSVDFLGNTTENWYDANGNNIETKRTDIATTAGISSQVSRTTIFYDALDRMTAQVDEAGNTTDYRYNSLGQMVAVGDSRSTTPSLRTFYRRGDTSNSIAATNLGNLTLSYYDATGRKVTEQILLTKSGHGDGLHIGRTIHGGADVLPFVDSSQGGGDGVITTKYEFSPDGHMTALVDDNGNRTEWSYDSAGRKVIETKGLTQSPALADRIDNPTSINWTYNSDGSPQTQTKEDGTVLHYEYDTARRLTRIYATDAPAGVVGSTEQTFEYNGLGAKTKSTDNNYHGQSPNDKVTCRWYYDSLGRVVEESQQVREDNSTRFFSTDYSCNDRASLVYPNERRVRYSYHLGGALKSIYDDGQAANPIARYDYFGGRTLRRAMQNGIDLDLRNSAGGTYYDALGRPMRWAHVNSRAGNALVVGWERSYEAGGNVIAQRSLHDAKDSQRYAYDSANRLTAFSRGDFAAVAGGAQVKYDSPAYCDAPTAAAWSGMAQAQQWHLDGVGSWKDFVIKTDGATKTEARQDTSFNEYCNIGGHAQDYDDNGNLTSATLGSNSDGTAGGPGRQLKWDVFNRLREVRTSTGTLIATYLYDAGNRRSQKNLASGTGVPGSGTSTNYYYTDWQIGETHGTSPSDPPTRQFTYGNYIDEPLSMDVNGNGDSTCVGAGDSRYFYHANPIYSVGALTNASSGIVEAYEYDPYGKHVLITDGDDSDLIVNFGANDMRTPMGSSTTATGNLYAFTGREYDGETGIQGNRERYYSGELGIFLQRDAVGYIANSEGNLYGYNRLAPIYYVDPFGKWHEGTHNELTTNSFNAAAPSDLIARQHILDAIISANNKQDSDPKKFAELFRHYNRAKDKDNSRVNRFREQYKSYVKREIERFTNALSLDVNIITKKDCDAALDSLGHVSHTWQDYYAHAVIFSTASKTAWTAQPPVIGTADDNNDKLKPSSWNEWYDTEEHGWFEPGGEEGRKRRNDATSYVTAKFGIYLVTLNTKCICAYQKE